MSTHVINRQVINLNVFSEKNAFGMQQRVLDLYNRRLLPILDELMTEISPGDDIIRLERIELDMGLLNFSYTEDELIRSMRSHLEAQMRNQLIPVEQAQPSSSFTDSSQTNKPISFTDLGQTNKLSRFTDPYQTNKPIHQSKEEAQLEILQFFFETGNLPWWFANEKEKVNLDDLILQELTQRPITFTQFLSQIAMQPKAALRMFHQSGKLIRKKWMDLLPELNPSLVKQLSEFVSAVTGQKPRTLLSAAVQNELHTLARFNLLLPEIKKKQSVTASTAAVLRAIAFFNQISEQEMHRLVYKELILAFIEFVKRKERSTNLLAYFVQWENESETEAQQIIRTPLIRLHLLLDEKFEKKFVLPEAIEQAIIQFRKEEKLEQPISAKRKKVKSFFSENQKKETIKSKSLEETIRLLKPMETEEETEAIIAHFNTGNKLSSDTTPAMGLTRCGGLALVASFLPAFFRELQLLDGDFFAGIEARNKAVHLLNFMATGKTKAAEHSLLLHKLLCGMEPSDAVPTSVKLTAAEKKETLIFLDDIAEQWTSLRSSSGELLRNTFMRRNGVILKKDEAWLLRVERSAMDVLLETIPWGLSVFRAPWSKQLLHIEW
jgi:Contractile injection system tape measure protein